MSISAVLIGPLTVRPSFAFLQAGAAGPSCAVRSTERKAVGALPAIPCAVRRPMRVPSHVPARICGMGGADPRNAEARLPGGATRNRAAKDVTTVVLAKVQAVPIDLEATARTGLAAAQAAEVIHLHRP